MNIKKCNSCGKVLEKTDAYYTIGEIEYHNGKPSKTIRLIIENDAKTEGLKEESWVNYTDLDFCEECFNKLNIKGYL